MKIRVEDYMVRVCVYDDDNNLICDEWKHQDTQPATTEEGSTDDMVYRIQRKVLIGGKQHHIRANTEQDYADKVGLLTLQAHNKAAEKQAEEAKVNFGRYAERWFATYCEDLAEATRLCYRRNLDKYIIPALGELAIDDIKPADIQALLNSMDGLCKSTKTKMHMVLKQILDCAIEEGIIKTNPGKSKSIKNKGKNSQQRQPYSVQQMQYIIQHLDMIQRPEDRAYIAVAALHPMRPEEVLGLMWDDINWEEGTVTIRRAVTHPDRNKPKVKETKTEDSVRKIGLSGIARAILEPIKGTGFIFGGDTPYSYTVTRKTCERIQKDLNFEDTIVPSRFRPTVISDLYQQTQDLKYVQQMSGHANVDTTLKHYINSRTQIGTGSAKIDALYSQ